MATTQKQLAERLGVAQITVSRALRGESNVKPALRDKILSAAERAGYSIDATNFEARLMRRRAVGAAVETDILCAMVDDDHDSFGFGGRILRGMTREADATGIEIVMTSHANGAAPRIVARGHVDGVIRLLGDVQLTEGYGALPVPWISVLYDIPEVDLVTVDNFSGMHAVGRYICSHGHRRIAFIGPETHIARERLAGLRAAAQEAGACVPDEFMRMKPQCSDENATRKFVASLVADGAAPFTALVGYNDLMADIAMDELRKRGIRVPGDVSIAGFDGVLPTRLHEQTRITTAAIPLEDLGAAAVQRLQRRIKLPEEPRKKIVLETTLIEGETVGPPSG